VWACLVWFIYLRRLEKSRRTNLFFIFYFYLPAAAGGESPNGSQISPCVAAAGREAGTEAVAVLVGGYMSYEEKDTCHMRRRIHVI